jgi:SAM-dependent methyltransferase
LRELRRRAEGLKRRSNIENICGSMFDLPFKSSSVDVVWSEGAMYIMGFENGLSNFRKLLKQRGLMAITELTWLADDQPEELLAFWNMVYPGMQGLQENLAAINVYGFVEIGHFVLPPQAWWENYYVPLKNRLDVIAERYMNDTEALKLIDEIRLEIDLYRKYSEYYGYVFYVMQKND